MYGGAVSLDGYPTINLTGDDSSARNTAKNRGGADFQYRRLGPYCIGSLIKGNLEY